MCEDGRAGQLSEAWVLFEERRRVQSSAESRSGACVQGAGLILMSRSSYYTERRFHWWIYALSLVFLWMRWELDVSGSAGPLSGAEPVTDHSPPTACSLPAVPSLQSTGETIPTP